MKKIIVLFIVTLSGCSDNANISDSTNNDSKIIGYRCTDYYQDITISGGICTLSPWKENRIRGTYESLTDRSYTREGSCNSTLGSKTECFPIYRR
jgi:uncharacterized protein YceK